MNKIKAWGEAGERPDVAFSAWYHTSPSPWFFSRAQATTREVLLSRLLSRQGRVLLARGDDGRARQRGAG